MKADFRFQPTKHASRSSNGFINADLYRGVADADLEEIFAEVDRAAFRMHPINLPTICSTASTLPQSALPYAEALWR